MADESKSREELAEQVEQLGRLLEAEREEHIKLWTRSRQLERLFMFSMDLLCVTDFNGHFKRVNPAFGTTLGYTSQELMERPMMELVHEDDVASTRRIMESLSTGRPAIQFQNKLRCADASYRWFAWNCWPVVKDGFIYAVARDMTEDVRVRQRLADSEERTRAITQALPDGVITLDANGDVVQMNHAAEKMFGYAEEEVVGQPSSMLASSEYREYLQGQVEVDPEAMLRRLVGRGLEGTACRRDGSTFPVEWSVAETEINGETAFVLLARDITELERNRDATARAQRDKERILQSAQEGICGLDLEGTVTFANASAARMTGFSPEDMVGNPLHLLAHHSQPDGSPYPRSECPVYRAFTRGETTTRETDVFWRKDGTCFPVDYTAAPELDEEGRITGAVVTFQDTTRRRQAEEALRRSEAMARAVMENAKDAIVAMDDHGVIQSFNPAAERMHGRTAAETVGMPMHELMTEQQWPWVEEELRRYFQTGVSEMIGSTQEIQLLRRDGTQFPSEISITEALVGGQQLFLGIGRDITDRKRMERALLESEERYRDLIESAGDLISIVGVDGTMQYANRAWLETLGYTEDELPGLPFEDFVHPDSLDDAKTIFERTLFGEDVGEIDASLVSRAGRRIEVRGSVTVRFENEQPVSVRGIFRDVTEKLELEKAKDEFLSVVSHELRTPLTSIRGSLGLLASGLLGDVPADATQMLDIAISNTDRVVRLINDILDLERLESRRVELELETVSSGQLMAQTVQVLQATAETAGVSLVTHESDEYVYADPDRVVQVLTNLAGNAIKFSPEGREVVLAARRRDREILFSVQDEGRGIPPEKLESVFGRFQQVDASDARDLGGAGLGLSISKQIVEQHGGRIWIESSVGEGSVFYFTLPAVGNEDDPEESLRPGEPFVLVCDDDPSVRAVLRAIVERGGFRCVTATSGQECLDIAAERRPSAIVLDMMMPGGMNGWDTIAALKAASGTSQVPVVVLSALNRPADAEKSLGVAEWLVKPADDARIFSALRRALSGDRLQPVVLLVEDDDDLALIEKSRLEKHGVSVDHVASKAAAIHQLSLNAPDLLVLDVHLPDGSGTDVLDWMREQEHLKHVPIVISTGSGLTRAELANLEERVASVSVKSGRQPEDMEQMVLALLERVMPEED